MAGICEYNHRDTAEKWDSSSPFDNSNVASVCFGVAFEKVIYDQYHQISYGYEGNDTSIFQGIQTAQETQGNDYEPI